MGATMRQICLQQAVPMTTSAQVYVFSERNYNGPCPTGSMMVTSEQQCIDAASVLDLDYYRASDWSHLPKGCIRHDNTNNQVWWNTNEVGAPYGTMRQICLQQA